MFSITTDCPNDAASILLDDPKSYTPTNVGVSCDLDDPTTDTIPERIVRYTKHRHQAERQAAYLAEIDPKSENACGHPVADIARDLRHYATPGELAAWAIEQADRLGISIRRIDHADSGSVYIKLATGRAKFTVRIADHRSRYFRVRPERGALQLLTHRPSNRRHFTAWLRKWVHRGRQGVKQHA